MGWVGGWVGLGWVGWFSCRFFRKEGASSTPKINDFRLPTFFTRFKGHLGLSLSLSISLSLHLPGRRRKRVPVCPAVLFSMWFGSATCRPTVSHYSVTSWADLGGNNKLNPAPRFSLDFRLSGSHGGPGSPGNGSGSNSEEYCMLRAKSAPETNPRLVRGFFLFFGSAAQI